MNYEEIMRDIIEQNLRIKRLMITYCFITCRHDNNTPDCSTCYLNEAKKLLSVDDLLKGAEKNA